MAGLARISDLGLVSNKDDDDNMKAFNSIMKAPITTRSASKQMSHVKFTDMLSLSHKHSSITSLFKKPSNLSLIAPSDKIESKRVSLMSLFLDKKKSSKLEGLLLGKRKSRGEPTMLPEMSFGVAPSLAPKFKTT